VVENETPSLGIIFLPRLYFFFPLQLKRWKLRLMKMKWLFIVLLGIGFLQACKTDEVALDTIAGTYKITSYQRNAKDTLLLLDSLPLALGENELVLSTNLYKGKFSGRIQSEQPTGLPPLGTFFQGEYYLSQREYTRVGTNNEVKPKTIIISLRTAQIVRTTLPPSDTLSLDTILYKNSARYSFMGEWKIEKQATKVGEVLELTKRGAGADSVNNYSISLLKLKE